MLIDKKSSFLLKQTRSRAKMYEYSVPKNLFVDVEKNIHDLMLIAIGALGNYAAAIVRSDTLDQDTLESYKSDLKFASKFFDAFLNSHLYDKSDDYLLLVGAAAYYLCDYIGSSQVLIKKIDHNKLNLDSRGIDKALVWLLKGDYQTELILDRELEYSEVINRFYKETKTYFISGEINDSFVIRDFKILVYNIGTPREILFADILLAIFLCKFNNSSIHLISSYTGISFEKWKESILNGNVVREFWPAQKKLGEAGVFKGASAVIQMPTSSGKTKSIAIAIRSAFLSEKTHLAVVVAPFRALCREISKDLVNDFSDDKKIHVDELPDVLQVDLFFDEYKEGDNAVLILTPEKLLYLLRQRPDIIHQIGIIVFDEGHLFDDEQRGVTYELLISTIIGYLGEGTQKILVSAVISNASQINEWLNDGRGEVISDNSIKSAEKTVAFTDWRNISDVNYGYLFFVNPDEPEEEEFYVPRVVEIHALKKLPREKKQRLFPEVDFTKGTVNNNDLAIYYSLKLCQNGGVAIFCGTRNTTLTILNRFLDLKNRNIDISSIFTHSNTDEIQRLCFLIEYQYGKDNVYYQTACKGIFAHHAKISNGIKVACEYAMKKSRISCIVCTSTLAQGVNLPIRYLLLSNIYQAGEEIQVRDFHNLIGRTGRSGMYTEGSIIMTETFVYNNRGNNYKGSNYKWKKYKRLLNANNSEECSSMLLSVFRAQKVDATHTYNPWKLVKKYYVEKVSFDKYIDELLMEAEDRVPGSAGKVKMIIDNMLNTLSSIESFLLSIPADDHNFISEEKITSIVQRTLAYHIANDDEKEKLVELFKLANQYIGAFITDDSHRLVFSKTLLGIDETNMINEWVVQNAELLETITDFKELVNVVYPVIIQFNHNSTLKKVKNPDKLLNVFISWIQGDTIKEIFDYVIGSEVKIVKRKREVEFELDDIVDICENAFGYEGSVIISALSEMVQLNLEVDDKLINLLNLLGREMRYGVKTFQACLLFEMGFSDRNIANDIGDILNTVVEDKKSLKSLLKMKKNRLLEYLLPFPLYFTDKLSELIR